MISFSAGIPVRKSTQTCLSCFMQYISTTVDLKPKHGSLSIALTLHDRFVFVFVFILFSVLPYGEIKLCITYKQPWTLT